MGPMTLLNGIAVDQPRDQWLDLGAYQSLEIMVRVLKDGASSPAGSLQILHAPVDGEPGAWLDLGLNISLTTTNPQFFSVSHFSRFIRWAYTNQVANSPIVVIDLVAKGG